MKKNTVFRIIDANLNRAREGLRVCEDIMRFFINDKYLTRSFKVTRHNLVKILETEGLTREDLLKYRDSRSDVGKNLSIKKIGGVNFITLFQANIQRAQEALRVLEEISKIGNVRLEDKFRRLRFRIYALESKASKKLTEHVHKKH